MKSAFHVSSQLTILQNRGQENLTPSALELSVSLKFAILTRLREVERNGVNPVNVR